MPEVQTQYRNDLIDRIKSIKDKNVIDEIYRLLDIDIDASVFETSQEQKDEIKTAQQQISDGLGISSDQADSEIDEWLKK